MDALRAHLLLLTLLAVKASDEFEAGLQKEVGLPDDLLEMLKKGMLDSAPTVTIEGPYVPEPSIPFPLARPTVNNILAICNYSNQRPLYTRDMLPHSGYDNLKRQATAINKLESWFTVCCSDESQDEKLILCCAQQAWEKSLSAFCRNEFRIKTSHYPCCKKKGPAKWDCFEKYATDTSYLPTGQKQKTKRPVAGFDFDPNSCPKTSISEVDSKLVTEGKTPQINFPPGRPNSVNIPSICGYHKHRPNYLTSCLPQTGFDWFAHQLKSINVLEKGFGQCCKENSYIQYSCAEGKWKKMVDRFCKEEKKVQENKFECCKKKRGEEQYDCFSRAAPNPDYMLMNDDILLKARPSLDMFCDMYTTLQKMKHLPFSVDKMAENCCILAEDKRSGCLQQQLNKLLDDACKAHNPSLTQVKQTCCKKNTWSLSPCMNKLLMNSIARAKRINNNRKKCPMIS